MDIDVAAQLAEISVSDFKALNPAMNKPVVVAAVTPFILLPWESVSTFLTNLAAAGDTPLTNRAIDSSTDTAESKPAATSAGTTTASRAPARATTTVAANKAPEVVLRRTAITPRRGETIAQLAARYGLPARTVAQWNKAGENQKLTAKKSVVLCLPQLNRAKQQDDDNGKKTKGGKAQVANQKADKSASKNADKKTQANSKQRSSRDDDSSQSARTAKSAKSKAGRESLKESSKDKSKSKSRESAKSSSKEAPKEKAASKKQPVKSAAKPAAKQKK